jgi:hypothetical protein
MFPRLKLKPWRWQLGNVEPEVIGEIVWVQNRIVLAVLGL